MINFNDKEIETINNIFCAFVNSDEEFQNDSFYKSNINEVMNAIDSMDRINKYENMNHYVVSALIDILYFPFAESGMSGIDLKDILSDNEINVYKKIYDLRE